MLAGTKKERSTSISAARGHRRPFFSRHRFSDLIINLESSWAQLGLTNKINDGQTDFPFRFDLFSPSWDLSSKWRKRQFLFVDSVSSSLRLWNTCEMDILWSLSVLWHLFTAELHLRTKRLFNCQLPLSILHVLHWFRSTYQVQDARPLIINYFVRWWTCSIGNRKKKYFAKSFADPCAHQTTLG